MIAIDNAVELDQDVPGLPKRVTSLQIPRKEFLEMSKSFPALLDALKRHASEKLAGIDLGELEWPLTCPDHALGARSDRLSAVAEPLLAVP
jgi:hypothetical protein